MASLLDQIFLDMNTNSKKIMDNQPVIKASTNAARPDWGLGLVEDDWEWKDNPDQRCGAPEQW